ncbi:MAG TPA: tetratricopeptide repeat protein [Pirellulaceae bacterium]|jgi:predicted O-linked N-acetylglucosamine transferase (SPINDLY family)
MPNLSDTLNTALEHHQAGRVQDAEQLYRQILLVEPSHPEALNYLGVIALQAGNFAFAADCLQRALAVRPNYDEAHCMLGVTLAALGSLDQAIIHFRQAIDANPDYPEAHFNLGIALGHQGKTDEQITHFRRTIHLRPDYPEAYSLLGIALTNQEQLSEALTCLTRALQLRPDFLEVHHNLGIVFEKQGQFDQAIECFQRALELSPNLIDSLNALGHAHQKSGHPAKAIECLQRLLVLNPHHAEAHINLGNALKDQAQMEQAVACYRRAVELRPDLTTAWSNLLYGLYFCPGYSSAAIYAEHARWKAQQAQSFENSIQPHSNDRSPNRPLRVGYVSANFRNHVSTMFFKPLFERHDKQEFQVFCYADGPTEGFTMLLRQYATVWRTIAGMTDDQAAQLIRQDQIDILVDVTMHMAGGRPLLFARKPAPVQVCCIAYPGTTGLTTIDYRLSDPHLDPPAADDEYYSEKTFRLPDTFWCFDPLTTVPAVNALPAQTNGYITFGSLNNFCKVNAPVLKLWAQVLKAADRSRLAMLAPEGSPRQWVCDVLQQEGITPDRVTFFARQSRQKYLELFHSIDIGLDTIPYNGHTTSLDALWMGVPVITIVGNTVVGRAGLCQCQNLGLPELVAESPHQFVRIATHLAADLPRLNHLRQTLRQRTQLSPLMDAPRFAQNLETAYRTMWHRWCES